MASLPARRLDGESDHGVTLQDKPLADPQLVYSPRPMTGFFAALTAEQRKRALGYRGEESFGDPEFKRS